MKNIRPFQKRLLPAPASGGFRMDGFWVWCGSVVRGEDGRYHMFAAQWPKTYPFFQGYLAASQVVRASADTPEGPYTFQEIVLPERGHEHWDGRMTHNPFIIEHKGEYLLFYIGATYEGECPSPDTLREMNQAGNRGNGIVPDWYRTIRIGMARSKSVFGPWLRPETPTFDINPDGWDNNVVTNPAPLITPEGHIHLYYRSGPCALGLAVAESPDSEFLRLRDKPIVSPDGKPIEDPCIFHSEGCYQMVAKDLSGGITGEFHAAVHLLSPDGIDWQLAPEPKAWSRSILWDDDKTTTQASIERPYILKDTDGKPTHLFAATADGPGPHDNRPGHYYAQNTWNMVIPLQ